MKYPFSPQWLDAIPEELAELFRGLELTLLENICSRLNLADKLNEVTVQDIRALRSHGIELDEIKKVVAETANIGMDKLEKLMDDVVERNQAYYQEVIDIAKVTKPERLIDEQDIDAIRRQTRDAYTNITRSMGFLVMDAGKPRLMDPERAYHWALDSAILQIESGAISYTEAIKSAVRQLAESGVRAIEYESGRTSRIDAAVRRAVMTGINQLNQKYSEQSMDYLETDLVQVSAHMGARDKGEVPENHKAWQGKVYRWAGKPGASTGKYPDFEAVCGYGLGEGIGGWNCRHTFSPFIEGVMERTYTDKELAEIDSPPFEYEGKTYTAYGATQKQRQIEAQIRNQRRLQAAYKSAGLEDEARAASAKLRRLNAKYRAFSNAAGLPEQKARLKALYD